MNIIIAIILILVVIGADYILYKKISSLIPKEPVVQAAPVIRDTTDDHVSNSEQRYMEGIENVLNYDVDTMRKYLRGEDEA